MVLVLAYSREMPFLSILMMEGTVFDCAKKQHLIQKKKTLQAYISHYLPLQ